MQLFSYVIDHDYGYAPNPSAGLCTLAKCKFGNGRKNVVERAEPDDWIVGTGGASRRSSGQGTLLYAMRVEDKIPLEVYCSDARYRGRLDSELDLDCGGRYALLSQHFYYFGRNAISLGRIPARHLDHPLEKRGPGFRSDFSPAFIEDFAAWLRTDFEFGVHGSPCVSGKETRKSVRHKKRVLPTGEAS